MKILNGKKIAEKILKDLAKKIKKSKMQPGLAVILVGKDEASRIYVKLKQKAAEKIGIYLKIHKFKEDVSEDEICKKIERLNKDKKYHGIIVQLPLPSSLDKEKIIAGIDPKKDVDGFHPRNRAMIMAYKEPSIMPVLPGAILTAIRAVDCQPAGRRALALVNSVILGEIMKIFLEKEGFQAEYAIKTICSIEGLEERLNKFDLIVTACGCPGMIKSEMIKKGVFIFDAGITRIKDKVKGDVDYESVKDKIGFLTPVPGGIGPITIALLLANVYLAAKNK